MNERLASFGKNARAKPSEPQVWHSVDERKLLLIDLLTSNAWCPRIQILYDVREKRNSERFHWRWDEKESADDTIYVISI